MRNIGLIVAIMMMCSPVLAGNRDQEENIPAFSDQDLDKYRKPQDTYSAPSRTRPAQHEENERSNDINKSVAPDTGGIANKLRDIWKSHEALLKNGKTQDALNLICSIKRSDYSAAFKAVGTDNMKQLASTDIDFKLIYIADDIAKFELTTNEKGGLYSYEVTFARDSNGNWCILQY